MCEMGVYVHSPGPSVLPDGTVTPELPEHTAEDQARILVKALLANRALGATRILVVNLVSWSDFAGDPQSLFNFMGLISSGTDSGDDASDLGHERIAYYSFRRLVAATETDVAELVGVRTDVDAPAVVVELRRRSDDRAIFVAWSDGAETPLELPWSAPDARVTDLVPDAAGDFTASTESAAGDRLSLTVGQDPLLVEPTQ